LYPTASTARLAYSRKKEKNGEIHVSFERKNRVPHMNFGKNYRKASLRLFLFVFLIGVVAVSAQDKSGDTNGKADTGSKDTRLTIVVTGGEDKKPIDSASVYVRYVEGRKIGKDKKIEMNLKTNQSGVCHVPVIPPGKFLVQVIAEGWKTYGEYYDINQTEQTINIALVRPPKWY
jgi:hypothetical protein